MNLVNLVKSSKGKIQVQVSVVVLLGFCFLSTVEADAGLTQKQESALQSVQNEQPANSIHVITQIHQAASKKDVGKTIAVISVPDDDGFIHVDWKQLLDGFSNLGWLRIGFEYNSSEILMKVFAEKTFSQLWQQIKQYDEQYNETPFYQESARIQPSLRDSRGGDFAAAFIWWNFCNAVTAWCGHFVLNNVQDAWTNPDPSIGQQKMVGCVMLGACGAQTAKLAWHQYWRMAAKAQRYYKWRTKQSLAQLISGNSEKSFFDEIAMKMFPAADVGSRFKSPFAQNEVVFVSRSSLRLLLAAFAAKPESFRVREFPFQDQPKEESKSKEALGGLAPVGEFDTDLGGNADAGDSSVDPGDAQLSEQEQEDQLDEDSTQGEAPREADATLVGNAAPVVKSLSVSSQNQASKQEAQLSPQEEYARRIKAQQDQISDPAFGEIRAGKRGWKKAIKPK